MNEAARILGSGITGADLQTAYAATNHLGLIANVYLAGASSVETGDEGRGRLFEGGAGYYRSVSERFVFETYGGAGFGSITHIHANGADRPSVGAQRVFLQPAIGFTSNWFDAAVSLRLCGLHYSDAPERLTDQRDIGAAQALEDAKSSFLAEPALTLRAGWKYFKLQFQLGFSRNLTHPDFPQVESYFSIGGYVGMKNHYKR